MSTLHIVRRSAFDTTDYLQCSNIIQDNDTLVLCDDGCYNLSHQITTILLNKHSALSLKIIRLHAESRAIIIPSTVDAIDMSTLVDLTFHHNKVITWQ